MIKHRAIATLGIGFGAAGIATLGFLAQPPEARQEHVVVKPAYYGVAGPAVFVPYPHKKPAVAPPPCVAETTTHGFDEDEIMLALFAAMSIDS